jgi:integrase
MEGNFYPDIHRDEEKYETVLKNLLEDPEVLDSNKELVLRFDAFCRANKVSYSRRWHYVQQLGQLAKWLGDIDFHDATKEDIIVLVGRLEEATYVLGGVERPFSARTKRDYKMALKKFYKHIEGDDEEYPKKVRWISTALKENEHEDLWDLVTEEEKKKLLDATPYPLYKAILAVFFDLGIRPSELLKMKVGDVIFSEDGRLYLRVPGFTKTGPRLLWARDYAKPYLSYYLDNFHPFPRDPRCPLWMKMKAKSREDFLRYRGLTSMLRKIVKRAGVNKRVWLYLFRHTRLTEWVNEVKEEHLRKLAGWKPGSQMVKVYSHITNTDALLALEGKEFKGRIFGHKKKNLCKICKTPNPAISKFCSQCGQPLREEMISRVGEEKMMKLMKFISKIARDNPDVWNEIEAIAGE